MFRHFVLSVSIIVIAFFAATAYAQDADAETLIENAEAKTEHLEWYQRFTVSKEVEANHAEWVEFGQREFSFSFRPDARWQLHLGIKERFGSSPLPREELTAKAYYSFSPRLRIGGEVKLAAEELDDVSTQMKNVSDSGIKLRSAYKF